MRRFLFFLAVILFLGFGVLYFISTGSYSEGYRAGTISKFSNRGYLFKTYEGELNVGGFSGETGSLTPQIWTFSVSSSNQAVITDLGKALKEGYRVRLKYEERYYRFFWMGDSKYYVIGVDFEKRPGE